MTLEILLQLIEPNATRPYQTIMRKYVINIISRLEREVTEVFKVVKNVVKLVDLHAQLI